LTEAQAIARAARVQPKIENQITLFLEKGENFKGHGLYTFTLNQTDGIFMDFCGKSVDALIVNEAAISKEDIAKFWIKGALNLPAQHLKVGPNIVRISFSNQYYHDGNGIHSFIDTDGKQYMYCQSEPFWANKIYPVFDQPDLKSYMTFAIQAPSDWVVVSNNSPIKSTPLNLYLAENSIKSSFENDFLNHASTNLVFSGDYTMHVFRRTDLISTYLHTFVAGPFKSIAYAQEFGGSVPMTIYCRESLFKWAEEQKADIFAFCQAGIVFFEKFFRTKFPFEKYDFIFCPEFTVGAMEYPGAVTFNDRYIFREKPTKNQISQRGMVILHELAHFWFGDLVTMKWWNDLWLNESFADYMCYLALANIPKESIPVPFVDGWSMFQTRKTWGYTDDSDITTHPIAGKVDSTDKADSIFDGITYSKGAAVLKQLYFLIGHDAFSEALGNYFDKFKWANATLSDLLAEIKKVVKVDPVGPYNIDQFNKDWIGTSGTTQLLTEWDPTKQGDSTLVIKQTPVRPEPEHNTLRYHRIEIAFFKEDGSIVALPQPVIVKNEEKTEIPFKNEGYKAVLLNHNDWAFAKLELDAPSLAFFKENLAKIPDTQPVAQLLIIKAFADQVRDAKLKGTDFTDILLKDYVAKTKNSLIFESVVNEINTALTVYTHSSHLVAYSDKVFDKLAELAKNPADEDIAKILRTKLVQFARSARTVKVLKDILEEANPELKNLKLTLEEQWTVLFKLYWFQEFSDKQRAILRAYLNAADPSDSKRLAEKTLDAFTADDATAQKLWDELANKDRKLSYIEMKAVFAGLNSSARSAESRSKFFEPFFVKALELIKTDQKVNARTFLEDGFPISDEFDKLIERTKTVLTPLTADNEYFQIILRKKIELLERRKKASEFSK